RQRADLVATLQLAVAKNERRLATSGLDLAALFARCQRVTHRHRIAACDLRRKSSAVSGESSTLVVIGVELGVYMVQLAGRNYLAISPIADATGGDLVSGSAWLGDPNHALVLGLKPGLGRTGSQPDHTEHAERQSTRPGPPSFNLHCPHPFRMLRRVLFKRQEI